MTPTTDHQPPRLTRRGAVRAFTLIEILIVVALLGIAGTLLIPSMTHVTDFETEAAVRQVVADLTFAQSDAVARQAKRRVLFAEDGSGYRLLAYPYDPDNDVLYDPISAHGNQQYVIDFARDPRFQGVSIESVDFDGGDAFITYDEMGGPIDSANTVSAGGEIVLAGDDQRFRIQVGAFTGSITVDEITDDEE